MSDLEMHATEVPAQNTSQAEEEHNVSAIEELQSAFPTILLLEKEKPKVKPPPMNQTWNEVLMENRRLMHDLDNPKPFYPRWNGSFALLSFPRELRDNIYFQYLYRPKSLIWRRRPNHGHEFRAWCGYIAVYSANMHHDALNMFLVSRQVYREALYIFCSANTIFIERRRHRHVEGALRLFPEPAASMLQHVELRYIDYHPNWHETWNGPSAGRTWEKMVKDALLAKEHFPRLTTYTALWDVDWRTLYENDGVVSLQTQSEDEKTRIWLWWLRRQGEARGVVPPRWLKVRFEPEPRYYNEWQAKNGHQASWDKALLIFKEEERLKEKEKAEELEESGKKWLEEEWGDGKRARRKGKGKDVI
ncbi:hypothetical protein K458DRAFT_389264 [Lentithecium fluviatile CBS 122367]|uniref:Uncharacterized protein n=1 Tax=Lentithecium fluviatile CBS 122367 TaxID=1168545 RepID=A0A6G1J0K0_9PLEO|nr:hypothetical protein K458DRAFT_389264 [Lentithecium fluviatile CBS 122367]